MLPESYSWCEKETPFPSEDRQICLTCLRFNLVCLDCSSTWHFKSPFPHVIQQAWQPLHSLYIKGLFTVLQLSNSVPSPTQKANTVWNCVISESTAVLIKNKPGGMLSRCIQLWCVGPRGNRSEGVAVAGPGCRVQDRKGCEPNRYSHPARIYGPGPSSTGDLTASTRSSVGRMW